MMINYNSNYLCWGPERRGKNENCGERVENKRESGEGEKKNKEGKKEIKIQTKIIKLFFDCEGQLRSIRLRPILRLRPKQLRPKQHRPLTEIELAEVELTKVECALSHLGGTPQPPHHPKGGRRDILNMTELDLDNNVNKRIKGRST